MADGPVLRSKPLGGVDRPPHSELDLPLFLRYRKLLAENCEFFLPHPCLMPLNGGIRQGWGRNGGTLSNFWMKLTEQKLEGWGYSMVKTAWSLTSTVFDWSTRVTDGRKCRSICVHMTAYAVACKNGTKLSTLECYPEKLWQWLRCTDMMS